MAGNNPPAEGDPLDVIAQCVPLPDGARITSATIVFDYLTPDGHDCWGSAYLGDADDATRLGLLALAQAEITHLAMQHYFTDNDDSE